MPGSKATKFETFLTVAFIVALIFGLWASWAAGYYIGTVILGLLVSLAVWSLADSLRAGFGETTAFEKFEQRMFIRMLVAFFGGGAILFIGWRLIPSEQQTLKISLILPLIAVWLGISAYMTWKLRTKRESAESYKRRVGYTEKE